MKLPISTLPPTGTPTCSVLKMAKHYSGRSLSPPWKCFPVSWLSVSLLFPKFSLFSCSLWQYHILRWRGARWLSGSVSDSGAKGRGFETYRRRVVSLSKTLYSPKAVALSRHDWKIVDWDVKPQHKQTHSEIKPVWGFSDSYFKYFSMRFLRCVIPSINS